MALTPNRSAVSFNATGFADYTHPVLSGIPYSPDANSFAFLIWPVPDHPNAEWIHGWKAEADTAPVPQ